MVGDKEARQERWHGDAVEEAHPGEAERAADRAEGNRPVHADDEAKRQAEGPLEDEPEDRTRHAASGETPEEKIEEAAEEHQEREAAGDRPPHGKL